MAIHVTRLFQGLAKAEMAGEGMPDSNLVIMPHPIAGESRETLRKQAKEGIEEIINALTSAPIKMEEKKLEPEVIEVIKVTGRDYGDAFEKFNRLFLEKHWGDGLPLVPPTKEKVDWMLTGIDRPRDDVIVKVRPRGRALTVETLAINAVMAGAIPAYMPVIVSAIEAFDQLEWGWGSVTTTSSVAPLVVVNGPIAKQLDINSKSNALGYGWRANSTIGRTLEMVFHTVGGAIPGISDMSTLGYSHTFTSVVFAENEDVLDEIGWGTYAKEMGFDKKTNTVSVSIVGFGYLTLFHYEAANAEEIMQKLIWSIKPLNILLPPSAMFILNPECVRLFAKAGWTRRDVMCQIAARCSEKWKLPIKEALEVIDWSKSWYKSETGPKWFKDLPADFPIQTFPSEPDDIHIFVAGGAGKESHFYPQLKGWCGPVTKEIKLPENWNEVLSKAEIRQTLELPKVPW